MNPIKRTGLKLFGLCVLALGLVAFSATAALAEGTWRVKGANLTSGSKALVGKLVKSEGALLATLGANAVIFKCTAAALENANLEKEGAVSEASKNAKVAFSGCKTFINEKEAKACEPKATGKAAGTIQTEEIYALLKEHSTGDAVTEIVPKTGNVFAVLHLGEACAVSEEVKVSGKLTFKDSGGNEGLLKEGSVHTIEEFSALTELKVTNAKSESKATLDGKAEAEVASAEVWSGLPPERVVNSVTLNFNPFDLNAEVVAGGGGGTCIIGSVFASLVGCTTTAATVTWRAL
jgi:hypothetical protein